MSKRPRRAHRHSTVIQEHHIEYTPPWTVKVFKGEHWVLTQLQRRRKVSIGFLISLQHWIESMKDYAVEI